MTTYLHFLNDISAVARNEALAIERGCGPTTTLWFNQFSHADGRRAFEVVNVDHEAYLNQAERDALVETLWYQNPLSGDIYVAVAGSQDGDGSINDPVNLATACSVLSTVAPGSIIHVQIGEYVGDYNFIHNGADDNRIIVLFEVGARIKGSFRLDGEYVTVNKVDVFDTPDIRWTEQTGSSPSFLNSEGLAIYGANTSIIHPMLQDVRANGVGFWATATDSILYGLWANAWGWDAPDRGHGHAPYVQNGSTGTKLIENCVLGLGYGGAMRVYTTNADALYNVTVTKNICIGDQLFLGGHSPAADCEISQNRIWGDMLEVGETDKDNQNILVDANYAMGYSSVGSSALILRHWKTPTITNNTFIHISAETPPIQIFPHVDQIDVVIDSNTYYIPDLDFIFAIIYTDNGSGGYNATYKTITQWQALGYDINSTFIEGLPTTNQVFVEHSTYDNDIAHVAIYNWEQSPTVEVDFSAGNFTLLATCRAYNALNPEEYFEFVYGGIPVAIPMSASDWSIAIPVGDVEPLADGVWPTFGAFVVKAI